MSEQPELSMEFDPDRDIKPRQKVDMVGREDFRQQFRQSLQTGRFPDTLLLAGPEGVGKARLAGWVAQALVCSERQKGAPCQACSACRLARRMEMPDLHWFFPHENPGSGSLGSQIEDVRKQQEHRRRQRQKRSLHPGPQAGESYYLATIKALQRQAWRKSSMGGRKVFVVTEAELLSPRGHTASEAANAFLKLLEEPPPGTHFLLTSSSPYRLPPTIRSRAAQLRVPPLSQTELRAIFEQALETAPEDLESLLARSEGSVRRVLRLLEESGRKHRQQALVWLKGLLEGRPLDQAHLADQQGFRGARTTFSAQLAELEQLVIEAMRLSEGSNMSPGFQVGSDLQARLRELSSRSSLQYWSQVLAFVQRARQEALANGNPRLILYSLLIRSRQLL